MNTILLPTDFSDNSWNAIKYALQLFKNEKCTFTLLNTFTPIFYSMEQTMMYNPETDLQNIVKKNSERRLKQLTNRIKEEFNNPNHVFTSSAVFNILTAEMENLYDKKTVDLVIMGTKGATGLKGVLFGSNTIHTIKRAKFPVLAIPDNFEYEAPHEILFPSDLEVDFTKKQLAPLITIATNHHARVNVLHVSDSQDLSKKQENNIAKLETLLKSISYLLHYKNNKDISDAISQFQIEHRINMLVMINNKHSFFQNVFFKSKVNQIGFHLNIPFLVIPSKKD
ncbi:universal stress protein [Olleya sp. HaHaR_3_96]|uniref:universal stress protein n=1 Tax=Olleya sp. HaHaR_3_96 TaxID=2745560 RepID=UPI001C4FB070|nr:universal stress protein [Olleya sp. HaHaR_3_96]QXP58337.1 universal stress protein [Olleya sp. HaHaR_3_96]